MTIKRIANVIKKEWEITFKSINNALFVTLVPVIIIAQVLLWIYLASRFVGHDTLANSFLQKAMSNLKAISPDILALSISEQFQSLLVSQIPVYLLMIPTMIAISLSTFSIVEEKQTGTLEPLLATPVRTWELLLGKALAGAIPAILISWICAGIFIISAILVMPFHILKLSITPVWFISLFLLVPSVGLLSFMLGVISSSKASDAKSAQDISILIIIPILGIIALQISGIFLFTPALLFLLTIGIVFLDILTLRIAVKLFRRESIVVRWK